MKILQVFVWKFLDNFDIFKVIVYADIFNLRD